MGSFTELQCGKVNCHSGIKSIVRAVLHFKSVGEECIGMLVVVMAIFLGSVLKVIVYRQGVTSI